MTGREPPARDLGALVEAFLESQVYPEWEADGSLWAEHVLALTPSRDIADIRARRGSVRPNAFIASGSTLYDTTDAPPLQVTGGTLGLRPFRVLGPAGAELGRIVPS